MFECKFCKKRYKSSKSFTSHIKRSEKHNFESEIDLVKYLCNTYYTEYITNDILNKYIEEYFCINDIKTYGYIIQLINILGIKRTHSDEKKTKRYKEKYIKSLKKKYGDNITNISQVSSVRNKINDTLTIRYGSPENYYSKHRIFMNDGYENFCKNPDKIKARQEKTEKTLKDKYGVFNMSQIPESKEKISLAIKKRISLMSEDEKRLMTQKAREGVTYTSSLEKRIQKCLVDLDEKFIPNIFLWGYNFDILIKDNILIEINGDFWHANPKYYESSDVLLGNVTAKDLWHKDNKKISKASQYNYIVITIWEDEIRPKNDEDLLNFVLEKIDNVRNLYR